MSLSQHEYQISLVSKLISTYQLSYEDFDSLKIISEQWIDECLKQNTVVSEHAFNASIMFKIATQGDRSMFH